MLAAEATNLGLATMARASGSSEAQLTRVYDLYFREETLRQVITALIHYPQTRSCAPRFGDATASALNARHNPPFYARRRGLMLYSHTSGQGPHFWIDAINCLLREATNILDGLIYQDILPVYEHYTDTHGSTDLIFGLFEILAYWFAPRLRDLPDQVLYRACKGADYGALNTVLRQTVRADLIVRHWDDINRLAASTEVAPRVG